MSVIKMTDLDLTGKRVLIRQDLNVPVKEGKVSSDKRIRASLPTIEHCIQAGARIMLMSHLGRPTEGQPESEFSLKPVADYLGEVLGSDVVVFVFKDDPSKLPVRWRNWDASESAVDISFPQL